MSTAHTGRIRIDDLPAEGEELSPEQLRLASGGAMPGAAAGGLVIRSYCPASCTIDCDTDYYRCD